MNDIACVVIGRNEGERLRRCLMSVISEVSHVIYVDSGSTDGSVDMARKLGVRVIELDMSRSFTAARARNEGLKALADSRAKVNFIQFVDGDCEVVKDWIRIARSFLDKNTAVAVVCGRRRERYPEQSIYNRLCDFEWNTQIGQAQACGGDAMFRLQVLEELNGYREDLIAGEEPELCVRIRAKGWKVWRLDEEMTLHDADMLHFTQWWKRCVRCGYAFAEGASIHGSPPERHWVKETRSALAYGFVFPLFAICLQLQFDFSILLIFVFYLFQVFRISIKTRSVLRGGFIVLGKFPEAVGVIKYYVSRLVRSKPKLIEYK